MVLITTDETLSREKYNGFSEVINLYRVDEAVIQAWLEH